MRIGASRVRAFAVTSLVGIWTVLTYACTGGIENPAYVYVPDSGNATGLSSDGTPIGADICPTYGGYDNVKFLADSILTTAKADCHLSLIIDEGDTHLRDCFEQFVGNGFQCKGVTFTENVSVDSEGKVCESIVPGLKLSPLDWAAFAGFDSDAGSPSAALSVLRGRGLTADQLAAIGLFFAAKDAGLLNADIRTDKYTKCSSGCGGDACNPDAGTPPPPPPPPPPKDSGSPVKDTGIADAPTDG